jgi:hypothetical protein
MREIQLARALHTDHGIPDSAKALPRLHKRLDYGDKHIEILEEEKYSDVENDDYDKRQFSLSARFYSLFYHVSARKVDQDRGYHYQKIINSAPGVKEQAGDKQEDIFGADSLPFACEGYQVKRKVYENHRGQEYPHKYH